MKRLLTGVIFAASVSGSACGGVGPYDRIGLAGASLALAGGATTWAGAQYVVPTHEAEGRTAMAVGSALTLTGLVMCVYALDAILRAEARADFGPSDAEWLREQRRRGRPDNSVAPADDALTVAP